ncbi:MAG: ABC transporter substrate-binding protein [Burkholderiales bacterium]|nr:ABC transporter substrate-binding protein [Burkholderiales bacterium]
MNLPYKAALSVVVALGLLTQAHAEAGITSTSITIGQSVALTGINKGRGLEFRRGAQAWFDHVNETGGINGRRINLVSLDDAYDPNRAAENTKALIPQSFALFGYIGAAPSLAGAKFFEPAGVPLIAPWTGEPSLHDNKLVWNLQGTYADEARAAMKHMAAMQLHNIAVFYQDDQLGKASLSGIREAAAANHMNVIAAVPVNRDGSGADAAAQKLLATPGVDAYFLATAYSNASHFVLAKRALGLFSPVYAQSAVGSDSLMEALHQHGDGVMVTQVVPNPTEPTNKMVIEFQHVTKAPYTYGAMQGFFSAHVLTDALKAAGANPTRSGLLSELRNPHGFAYGPGLFVDAQGYRHVEISILSKSGSVID